MISYRITTLAGSITETEAESIVQNGAHVILTKASGNQDSYLEPESVEELVGETWQPVDFEGE